MGQSTEGLNQVKFILVFLIFLSNENNEWQIQEFGFQKVLEAIQQK